MKENEWFRSRKMYFLFILITIIIGLSSRSGIVTSNFIRLYVGDIFYALMYFWLLGFIFPKMSSIKVLMIMSDFVMESKSVNCIKQIG